MAWYCSHVSRTIPQFPSRYFGYSQHRFTNTPHKNTSKTAMAYRNPQRIKKHYEHHSLPENKKINYLQAGRRANRRRQWGSGSGAKGSVDGVPKLRAGDEAGVVLDGDEHGFRVGVVLERNFRRVVYLKSHRCRREVVSCFDFRPRFRARTIDSGRWVGISSGLPALSWSSEGTCSKHLKDERLLCVALSIIFGRQSLPWNA